MCNFLLKVQNWRVKIYTSTHSASMLISFDIFLHRQKNYFLPPAKPYKYMHRPWILIGQSLLKTIRTIGDKKSPSRGRRSSEQEHAQNHIWFWPAWWSMDCYSLSKGLTHSFMFTNLHTTQRKLQTDVYSIAVRVEQA